MGNLDISTLKQWQFCKYITPLFFLYYLCALFFLHSSTILLTTTIIHRRRPHHRLSNSVDTRSPLPSAFIIANVYCLSSPPSTLVCLSPSSSLSLVSLTMFTVVVAKLAVTKLAQMESKKDRWTRGLEWNNEWKKTTIEGGGEDVTVVEVHIWTEDEGVAT